MGSRFVGDRIVGNDERHSYCVHEGLTQSYCFQRVIRRYVGALLNGKGGKLYLGVDGRGYAVGLPMTRKEEDLYRLALDDEISHFTPPISHGYTVTFIPLLERKRNRNASTGLGLIVVRIRPGEPSEIYEDRLHEVHIMRGRTVHGPLRTREIRDQVLEKLKRELQCGGVAQVLSGNARAPPPKTLQAIAEEDG